MVSRRELYALALTLGAGLSGAAAGAAWANNLWLSLSGAICLMLWLAIISLLLVRRSPTPSPAPITASDDGGVMHRLLLDASPTPLVLVDDEVVSTLNRASRRLFATDDRVLPAPAPLLDHAATHLRHLGRNWRADRVEVGRRTVVALIDVEGEERAAEARASAEMIQVLGHELLNGLVPIVSLAECGIAAAEERERDPALLREVLTTLARRAEGLQRFTEAYRALARLPSPLRQLVFVADLIEDLARLFASRWPTIRLSVDVADELSVMIDHDQVSQAVWALLQNAAEAVQHDGAPLPHVILTAHRIDADLTIDVSDSGTGVPAEQARSIFRPFHTTKDGGSGIGLSLARQIAQAHGGTLSLMQASPPMFRLQVPVE